MEIEENAIKAFRGGLNCSQAVFTAFAGRLGFDREMAEQVATGFGGGMGRLQETCGVVTGAFMAIGVHNSRLYPDNVERKENTYAMVQDFNARFLEAHPSNQCSDLLGCNLRTQEGRDFAKEHDLHGTICEGCMLTSVRILNEMIPETK